MKILLPLGLALLLVFCGATSASEPELTTSEPELTITFPSLTKGETYNITWEASGLDTVEVLYRNWTNDTINTRSVTGKWERLPAYPGIYSWTIPLDTECGRYTIRINGYRDGKYVISSEVGWLYITEGDA